LPYGAFRYRHSMRRARRSRRRPPIGCFRIENVGGAFSATPMQDRQPRG
jgi:hypothetical protein